MTLKFSINSLAYLRLCPFPQELSNFMASMWIIQTFISKGTFSPVYIPLVISTWISWSHLVFKFESKPKTQFLCLLLISMNGVIMTPVVIQALLNYPWFLLPLSIPSLNSEKYRKGGLKDPAASEIRHEICWPNIQLQSRDTFMSWGYSRFISTNPLA